MSVKNLSTRNIIGLSLTLLLVARLFVVAIIPILTKTNNFISPTYAYVIISYLAITAILSLELKNLDEFHIDHISLWLLIVSCFVRSRLGLNNETLYLLPMALAGLLIFFQATGNRSIIPRTKRETIVGGTILACIVLAVSTIVESLQARTWINPS